LYFSLALSLARLEQLVHMAPDEIPDDYVYTSVDSNAEPEAVDYRGSLLDVDATRRYGHRWATAQKSLVVLVPSVIFPMEFNLLVNPLHAAFTDLVWGEPRPFAFDPRLLHGPSAV
jgi:RES domain-containing protein